MRSALIVVVLAGTVALTLAAGGPGRGGGRLASPNDARAFTEQFLTTLEERRAVDAFQLMRQVITDPQTDVDMMRNNVDQTLNDARNNYGRPIGHELVDSKTLGTSFVRFDYLFRLEKSALQFRIIYYRGRGGYQPVQLYFQEDLEELFYEVAK
jgi:hypothetical protein